MALTKARKRQLNRIKSFFRRAEKKGFSWSEEYKQQVLQSSTNKLRNIKPRQLYKEAVYTTKNGTVTAQKGLEIRRKIGAKKGVLTKTHKKWLETQAGKEYGNQLENGLEFEFSSDYIPTEGELVFDKINKMITQYPTKGAKILSKSLEYDIKNFGVEKVIKALAVAPDFAIQAAQVAVFYFGNSDNASNMHRTYTSFFDLIRGEIPSTEDRKMIGEILDDMALEVIN